MLPFSLFYRADRRTYYVAFKNEVTGRYLSAISTKKTKQADAIRQAWAWYREGIPRRGGSLDLKTCSLRDTIKHSDISPEDARFIVDVMKRRGFVLSCVFADAPDSVRFADYLEEFWDWDRSPFIREKLRMEHSIHRNYAYQMLRNVKKYWTPFFPSALLGEILPGDLERFADHLSAMKYSRIKDELPSKYLTSSRKNNIIKAGVVPLRWAYRKEKIGQDVTRGLVFFSGKSAERRILVPELAAKIFTQKWDDERSRAANMTAMVTGLRAGELQGLLYSGIGEDSLTVRHSWNYYDGLKCPKNTESRTIELPFPAVLKSLRYIAELNPHGAGPDSFVFWSSKSAKKPMERRLFLLGLRSALASSGLSDTEASGYDFHAWRHFFTTYMRDKVEDKLLQSQTGHKSMRMLDRYSAHRRSGERDKIRDAQIEVFSALLPGEVES